MLAPEEENWVQKDSKKARKVREQLLKKYGVEVSERTLPPHQTLMIWKDSMTTSDELLFNNIMWLPSQLASVGCGGLYW